MIFLDDNVVINSYAPFCPLLSMGKDEKVACNSHCAWFQVRDHDSGACALHNMARFTGEISDQT